MSRSARPPPRPGRILAAKLTGTATRHAKWRDLTPEEHTAAVTELRDLAAGRTGLLARQAGLLARQAGLLARQAGLLTGCCEHSLHGPIKRQAAGLLIAAGADTQLIPQWIEEGRRRRP
jgi:hypothetical protein